MSTVLHIGEFGKTFPAEQQLRVNLFNRDLDSSKNPTGVLILSHLNYSTKKKKKKWLDIHFQNYLGKQNKLNIYWTNLPKMCCAEPLANLLHTSYYSQFNSVLEITVFKRCLFMLPIGTLHTLRCANIQENKLYSHTHTYTQTTILRLFTVSWDSKIFTYYTAQVNRCPVGGDPFTLSVCHVGSPSACIHSC